MIVGTQRNAKPAAQAPVSAHPLFPAIVALWFAALLGIGSMVLPQALFDRIGVATGMGELGFTFRLGFGLVAGLVGAAIGILLARKVAAGQASAKGRKRAPEAPARKSAAKKPISAMEELGSDGLDEPLAQTPARPGHEPINGRRRPLMVTDESEPSDYMMHVPLPGSDGVLDLIGAEDFAEEDALELGHFDQHREDEETMTSFTGSPAPARPGSSLFGTDPFGEPESDEPLTPPLPAAPSAGEGIFRAPEPAMYSAPNASAAPFAPPAPAAGPREGTAAPTMPFAPPVAADPFTAATPAHAQSAPFAPPAQPAPQPFGATAFSMPIPAPAEPEPIVATAAPVQPPAAPQAVFPGPIATPAATTADLTGLDTVALVERFARALREAGGATAMPQPVMPFTAPVAAAPAAPFTMPFAAPEAQTRVAETAAEASVPANPSPTVEPSPFGAQALPAALAPLSFDDADDHDEHDRGFSLPFARQEKPFAMPTEPAVQQPPMPQAVAPSPFAPTPFAPTPFAMPQAVSEQAPEPESEQEAENEDSFGSLLAMKAGFAPSREFVRIEDDEQTEGTIEPVVVFPGTAQQGRAAPAPDGPTRDPGENAPFARPPFAPPVAQRSSQPADPNATEAALRDALARLQQMSGAA